MPTVRLNFRDSRGRSITRSVHNVNTIVSTVISDIATLMPLWDPLTDLAYESATIVFVDPASAFAGAAVSNRDENVSLQVQGLDGRLYDFDLPDVPDAKMPTELIDTSDLDLTNFIAQFASPNPWRINLNNPTEVAAVIKGVLDK